jgi:protease II
VRWLGPCADVCLREGNVSLDADFSPDIVSLLESGGIYAMAHVRGGAEKGLPWYDAGRVLHKSRTYADLADVARYLTAQGYISAARLGVTGASNGGT